MRLDELIIYPKKEDEKKPEPREETIIDLKKYRETKDYLRLVSSRYASEYFG